MASELTFQPARPRRAFDEIVAQVRGMVRSGELQPGDRLPAERVLAEQFGVSRNSVREALRMMEISGLVALRTGAGGGAFVAQPDPGVAARGLADAFQLNGLAPSDVTEARLWLESTVVRVACERMTEEYLQALYDNVNEAAQAAGEDDWERTALVHVEFHNLLADATGNPVMSILMRSMADLLHDLALAIGPSSDDVIVRSRRRLLRHLRNRDGDKAAEEMRRYLNRLHRMWLITAEERRTM
ncbi:MAG TPA: FCD domain-containing protein [Pseudonocardia sp.]|jgi:DNA-binding FadR family transcriptional regulator|uniref:FadR/GntR family transcriptional regulator n=1 Tax=Pseudonocardia sp. TaxID=60912 RepID=UPI002ED9199D